MAIFLCSCCGSEVTSPYFYGKGVYGYSCIKKVNPNAKKKKYNIAVKADSIEIVGNKVIAKLYGKKINVTEYSQIVASRKGEAIELNAMQLAGYFPVFYGCADVRDRWIYKNDFGLLKSENPLTGDKKTFYYEYLHQPVEHIDF